MQVGINTGFTMGASPFDAAREAKAQAEASVGASVVAPSGESAASPISTDDGSSPSSFDLSMNARNLVSQNDAPAGGAGGNMMSGLFARQGPQEQSRYVKGLLGMFKIENSLHNQMQSIVNDYRLQADMSGGYAGKMLAGLRAEREARDAAEAYSAEELEKQAEEDRKKTEEEREERRDEKLQEKLQGVTESGEPVDADTALDAQPQSVSESIEEAEQEASGLEPDNEITPVGAVESEPQGAASARQGEKRRGALGSALAAYAANEAAYGTVAGTAVAIAQGQVADTAATAAVVPAAGSSINASV